MSDPGLQSGSPPFRPFSPQDFLSLAKSLQDFQTPHLQGIRRTVLGRAYYAAFLDAREKVRRKYPQQLAGRRGKIGVHQHVRDLLKQLRAGNIADKLYDLFQYRERADYNLQTIIDVDDVEKSVQLAENIVQLLRNLKI